MIDACLLTLKLLAKAGRRAGREAALIMGGANATCSTLIRHNELCRGEAGGLLHSLELDAVIAPHPKCE